MTLATRPGNGGELPDAALLVQAFRGIVDPDFAGLCVLDAARSLAICHCRRRIANRAVQVSGASDRYVAACWRVVTEIDNYRTELMRQIDGWVIRRVWCNHDGTSLHTETIGAVIDRLAMEWARADDIVRCTDNDGAGRHTDDRAHTAMWRCAELRDAYNDLAEEIIVGRRRLPLAGPNGGASIPISPG